MLGWLTYVAAYSDPIAFLCMGTEMKNSLKLGSAIAALACALGAPAFAQDAGDEEAHAASSDFILPSYGQINPFYGDINPFYGQINPFYGQISPFWGDVTPFWGQINPFYGQINPFYGQINPFWGDISPFYGQIDPFWGQIDPFYGDINAFWSDISAFWGDIGPFWGDINAFWGNIDAFSEEDFAKLAADLDQMFADAEATFGFAVNAKTGLSLDEVFLNELRARFGIDTSDPESLANLSAAERSEFFLAFYDGLMNYTGVDHVDHWMPSINWSPALSQRVGGGSGVTVGMLDFSLADGIDGLKGSGRNGAYLDFNHGEGVANLIAADMDGEGIMGVAPDVSLRLYNPFDESLTASWSDVGEGVIDLAKSDTDIINLSLGVPGWTFHQNWADVFSNRRVQKASDEILFVFAAGNDGVTQTIDVDWSDVGEVENLLIVGSVNPLGEISSFSNRPGEACLTTGGMCAEGHRLMDRFLVAPGELILMPDGEGGLTRMSGTSFAAPLVSGAAALVKGRWNWLEAGDVAAVLLWSARDLGEEGVDPVYGWGMLDVDASFRPFNPENLYLFDRNGDQAAADELGIVNGQILSNVEDGYVTVFEDFRSTFRDFQVSVDDITLSDDDTAAANDGAQDYIEDQTRGNGNKPRFTQTLDRNGDVYLTAFSAPLDTGERASDGELMFQAGFTLADRSSGNSVEFGMGEASLAFAETSAFNASSDYRPNSGGVNPVLGFASGGAYMAGDLALSPDTSLRVIASSTRDAHRFANPLTGEWTNMFSSLDAYEASALGAGLRHGFGDAITTELSYTRLSENGAMLGAQGLGALGFAGRTTTDAVTAGVEAALPFDLAFAASATVGRTNGAEDGSAILGLDGPLVSTAFQVSVAAESVFSRFDTMRVSFIQPLHVESGALAYTAGVITDRATGQIGQETQLWDLSGDRSIAAEVSYGFSLDGDRLELGGFGRVEGPQARFDAPEAQVIGGLRFKAQF